MVLPVTIIGGYLGSGKTTLVNHLLRHADGVRLAVLVNDFGELPIDADLIEAQDGDVISLSGGCVCCSYGDDLSLSLQKLQSMATPPDHIFIEASGVALPAAIGKSLSLLRAYRLEGIVVLADATTIQASAHEKYIGDTIHQQLSDADLIVLNKLDLLSKDKVSLVRYWMHEHYSNAPQVDSVYSTINPEVLFELKHRGEKAHTPSRNHHHAAAVFSSVKLVIDQAVDASKLASLLADQRCGLVRAKGFVQDIDGTMKTIQVVGRRWSVSVAPANVQVGLVCIANSASLTETGIRSFCKLNAQVAL